MGWPAMASILPLLLLLQYGSFLLLLHAEPRLPLSSTSQFLPALSWPATGSSSNPPFVNRYSLLPHGPFNLFAPILSSSNFSSSSDKGFSLGFLSVFPRTDAASPSHVFLALCFGTERRDNAGQIFAVPVWLANKDKPLTVSKEGRIGGLKLNAQRELLLVDGDGRVVWSVQGSVESMELRKNGNLAIYSTENKTICQSFDFPGDGLLQGQSLPLGKKIVSSNSLYAGEMRVGGLLFYLQSSSNVPLAYFVLALNETVEAYFNAWINQGSFQLSRNLPVNLTAAIDSDVPFTPPCRSDNHTPFAILEGENLTLQYADKCPSDFNVPWPILSYFQNQILGVTYNSDLIRLDADGIIRGYTYVYHKGQHMFSSDREKLTLCIAPNACGSHGLCSHYVLGQEHKCKCPSADDNPDLFNAFTPVSSHDPSLGCRRTVPLQCKDGANQSLVKIEGATFISFRAIFEATLTSHRVPLDECLSQCASNCSCSGIYYHRSSSFCLPFSDRMAIANVSLLSLYTQEYVTYLKLQFNDLADLVAGASKSGSSSGTKMKHFLAAWIVAGLLVVGCVIALLVAYKRKQRSKKEYFVDEKDPELQNIIPMLPTKFSYKELRRATNGFSKVIGKGAFGSVFEGVLPDSRKVAVKRLEMVSPQVKPFLTEVATIGSISHYNVVRLCGFCSERSNRLLVYEYMENSSLDRWLFHKESNVSDGKERPARPRQEGVKVHNALCVPEDDSSSGALHSLSNGETSSDTGDDGVDNKQKAKMKGKDRHEGNDNVDNKIYTVLSWEKRCNIALGTAWALKYLHEDCPQPIIHFDIKPENILLDTKFVPKISDFGLAKLVERGASAVYTMVRGTAGYMAPEWLSAHTLVSKKCDVYSYGMVLLELIGGRRNADAAYVSVDQYYFPKWAAICCKEGKEVELVDKRLRGCYDEEQVKRFVQVAFLCIHKEPESRPSMGTVCKLLEGSMTMPSGMHNGMGDTSEGEQVLPLGKLLLQTLSQYNEGQATSEVVYATNSGPSLPYSSIEGR